MQIDGKMVFPHLFSQLDAVFAFPLPPIVLMSIFLHKTFGYLMFFFISCKVINKQQ